MNTALLILLVLHQLCTVAGESSNTDQSDCHTGRPEFSHVSGQPKVTPVWGPQAIAGLDISWTLSQVLGSPNCADAFEVEYQTVGAGRLSWSAWSAMVSCAPTRQNQTQFSCSKPLTKHHCASRMRFRIIPHNSQNFAMTALGSPYHELVIKCRGGVPVEVLTDRYSVGNKHRPLGPAGRSSMLRAAMARDDLLRRMERRRGWIRKNNARKEAERRTTTTSTTTTSTTTTTTTTTTTSTTTTTTMKPLTIATSKQAMTTNGEAESPNLDPTLDDAYYSYEDYYEYYDKGTPVEEEVPDQEPVVLHCEYADWGPWTNCTNICGSGTKSRFRDLLQGTPEDCSFTNMTKSCFGRTCPLDRNVGKSERATLLPGKFAKERTKKEYEVRSNLKDFDEDADASLYCVHLQVVDSTRSCRTGPSELVSLQPGGQVCGLCTSKAVRPGEVGCVGDGAQDTVTAFRMLLESSCYGTWRMLAEYENCPCSINATFIFV